jgi:hypothetical protein
VESGRVQIDFSECPEKFLAQFETGSPVPEELLVSFQRADVAVDSILVYGSLVDALFGVFFQIASEFDFSCFAFFALVGNLCATLTL